MSRQSAVCISATVGRYARMFRTHTRELVPPLHLLLWFCNCESRRDFQDVYRKIYANLQFPVRERVRESLLASH